MGRWVSRGRWLGITAALAFGLAGCEDASSSARPSSTSTADVVASHRTASGTVTPKRRARFSLSFNGAHAREVLVLEGSPRRLSDVATAKAQDVRTWRELVVTTTAGSSTAVPYRERFLEGHEARVYSSAEGVNLGIFAQGGEAPVQEIAGVRAIDLRYDEEKRPLEVTFGGEIRTLDPAAWKTLTIVPKGKEGRKGAVRLLDALRQIEGMTAIGSVAVKGRRSRTFCAAELDGTSQEVLLRENRRGELMLDLWRPSDDDKPSSRMRGLEQLVVRAAPCDASATTP